MSTRIRTALLALTPTLAPMPALAQSTDATTPADTSTATTATAATPNTVVITQDRGTAWGWLGLLGLAGLAGLRRPAPMRIVTTDTPDTMRTTAPPP